MHARALISILAITGAGVTAPVVAQQAVFGQWRVTGAMCPTECAMSRTEVEGWRGRVAGYSDTLARFGEHACRRPRYAVGFWPASGKYGGASLRDLGISGDSVMVVEVQCPAQPQQRSDPRWQAPGAFLIVKDGNHISMVWEGVYFELTRQ
jgi:hypothetical protein